jgi:outer membrane protein
MQTRTFRHSFIRLSGLVTTLVLLATTPFPAQAQQILSLKESVQFALQNSPQILKSKLETRKAEAQVAQQKSAGLPQVEISSNMIYNVKLPTQLIPNFFQGKPDELVPVQFGTDLNALFGLEVNQLLYSQTYWTGLKAVQELRAMSAILESKTQEDLAYNVARTYYQAKMLEQQKALLQVNLAQVLSLIKVTEKQFENGFARKVDVDQLRVNQVNLQTQLQNLDLQYEQAVQALKFAMAMPQDQPLTLSDTLIADPASLAMPDGGTPNFQNKTDLLILDRQINLNNLNTEVYRAGYYPTVRLFGGYNFQGQANTLKDFGDGNRWFDYSQIGLNIRVPIFDGFLKRSQIQQSDIEVLKLNEDRRQLLQSLQFQHGNALRQMKTTWNTLQSIAQNQKVAEEVYAVSQKRFEQGLASVTELLAAERSMREVQASRLVTLLQYNLARLDLEYANGRILQLFN